MRNRVAAIRPPVGLTRLLLVTVATVAVLAASTVHAEDVFLEINIEGLENLGAGWAYEGWLIVDGSPVTTGVFTIDDHGMLSQSRFAVPVDGSDIGAFVLTIEPVPDADPAPSAVHVLAGDFSGSMAQLSVGHGAALGDDFSSAAGTYILAAPSGGDGADYRSGIWWLDPEGGPGPSLQLPALPAGWAYEGWVVGSSGPMSTGRFTSVSGDDSDRGGITAGPHGTPPFPGQDLLNPATVLTDGYAAVISVEPDPDNSPAPFALKPLVDGDIEDVGAGTPQSMANMTAGFPSGSVMIHDSAAMSEIAHLRLQFDGLEDLGPDSAYEGWLIVDGAAVSTGVFTVSGGVMSETYFPTTVSSLDAVSTFVLTIEPSPDSDPGPSSVHLVAGDFAGRQAALDIGHPAALGTDFSGAMGGYILAAPSSGGSAPYQNGIWWLDPGAGPGPSLSLPQLPDGWVYEGWVAGSSGPVSTGRFSSVEGADSDGAGPDAGSEPGPPFPGQDFVDPAVDLTMGYAAVISVEPEPDNAAAPFSIKPLMDRNIDDVGEGVLQPMSFNGAGIPSGRAWLMAEQVVAAAAHVGGVNQSVWRTDLDIHNTGASSQLVEVELLRADQANPMPERSTIMLAPYASVRYVDVIASLFDTEGVGSIRILSAENAVTSSSRTYNDEADGTFGQGIPAESMSAALGFGDVGRLVGLSASAGNDDGFRTNIGVVNLGAAMITVNIDLYAGDGSYLETVTVELDAYEQTQVNRVFSAATEVGYAEVRTETAGASYLAYGSVVDNITGDPTYIAVR